MVCQVSPTVNAAIGSVTVRKIRLKRFHHFGEGETKWKSDVWKCFENETLHGKERTPSLESARTSRLKHSPVVGQIIEPNRKRNLHIFHIEVKFFSVAFNVVLKICFATHVTTSSFPPIRTHVMITWERPANHSARIKIHDKREKGARGQSKPEIENHGPVASYFFTRWFPSTTFKESLKTWIVVNLLHCSCVQLY